MRRAPPHPHLSDSSPANSRRWRSSRRLANNTMAARNSSGHQVGVGQGPPESGRGHQQPSGAGADGSPARGRSRSRGTGRRACAASAPRRRSLRRASWVPTPRPVVQLVDECPASASLTNASAVATRCRRGRSGRRRTPTGRVRRSRRARRGCSSRRDGSSWVRAWRSLSLRNAVRLLTRVPRAAITSGRAATVCCRSRGRRRCRRRTGLVSLWHHYGLQIPQ